MEASPLTGSPDIHSRSAAFPADLPGDLEGEAPPATSPVAAAPHRLFWLLAMVGSGAILLPLNTSMLGLALPRIMDDFGVSVSAATWLMISYMITVSATQPLAGRLGDKFGHQRIFNVGMICFAAASVVCARAPSFSTLILGRVLQGICAAALLPNGFTLVRYHTAANQRGRAIGFIGGISGTSAAFAPAVGGLLVAFFSWQAIFWINVPIVLLGLVIATLIVGKVSTPRDPHPRFDHLGSLLLAAFAVSLTLAISLQGRSGLPPLLGLWLGLGSAVSLGLFLWHEQRAVAPFLHLSLFRIRTYVAATFCSCFLNLTTFGIIFMNPLILQQVLGYTPGEAGTLLLAFSGVIAIAAPLGGTLSDRFGRRLLPTIGLVLFMFGNLLYFAVDAASGMALFLLCFVITGAGFGLAFAVLQTAALEASPPEHSGVATGVYLMARYVGGAVGVSIVSGATIQATGSALMPSFHRAIALLIIFTIPALALALVIRPRFDLTRLPAGSPAQAR